MRLRPWFAFDWVNHLSQRGKPPFSVSVSAPMSLHDGKQRSGIGAGEGARQSQCQSNPCMP
jgi:hypothetical protein